MAISTPTINKIFKVKEFDVLRTEIVKGNMYICVDSMVMYYDESDVSRTQYSYIGVRTVNDLFKNITPDQGTTYYCWEDNSLWIWMNKWISLYTESTYPDAYIYDDYNYDTNKGTLTSVYREDAVSSIVDNNGLLRDGSVVVRDKYRIIKAKLSINDDNDNLIVSSFFGGGIRFLPNGRMSTEGELFIADEGESFLRSTFVVKDNEIYVDYSENQGEDDNPYPNDEHRYQVFHEGNLDVSALKVLTPREIYDKLLDPSLPKPFAFNVLQLQGKEPDDFAAATHTHLATDITDFNDKARRQANLEIKTVFNNLSGEGITADTSTSNYKLSADNFTLTFTGGAQGSATVNHLTDTTIELSVIPTRHIHDDYILRMDNLQEQINNINAMDPDDYYTKLQVDDQIAAVAGSDLPIPGRTLKVNDDGVLPGATLSAGKLTSPINLNFIGDITGTVQTDFSEDVNIELTAQGILSDTPVAGKGLMVDDNLNLPGNALTSSALTHKIPITISGEATGQGELDTTEGSVINNIVLTLNPGDNILQTKDLGESVAPINTETGKIDKGYLPGDIGNGLTFVDYFSPRDGYPSTNPSEGQFWISNNDDYINSGGDTETLEPISQEGIDTIVHTIVQAVRDGVEVITGLDSTTRNNIRAVMTQEEDNVYGTLKVVTTTPTTEQEQIVTEYLEEDENIGSFYNVQLELTDINDNYIGTITELDNFINIGFTIPSLPDIPEGYDRVYRIVLVNTTGVDSYRTVDNKDGVVAVSSKKLESVYSLLYYDKVHEEEEPDFYKKGDWCIFINNNWVHLHVSDAVNSVNGQTGDVLITTDSIGAIPRSLIEYTASAESPIPDGYIVKTTGEGIITGASIDKLTNPFNITTISGTDVQIENNCSTDGSTDAEMVLRITQEGFNNIKENVSYNILNTDNELEYKPNLNFTDDFVVSVNEEYNKIDIALNSSSALGGSVLCCYYNVIDGNVDTDISNIFTSLDAAFENKDNKDSLLVINYNNALYFTMIDKNSPSKTDSTHTTYSETVDLVGYSYPTYRENNTVAIYNNIINISLHCDENNYGNFNGATITDGKTLVFEGLSVVSNQGAVTPFNPTQDWHPATKEYVDLGLQAYAAGRKFVDTFGGKDLGETYEIVHNLNSSDIIFQYTDVETGELLLIDTIIQDNNTIIARPSMQLPENSVKICILK